MYNITLINFYYITNHNICYFRPNSTAECIKTLQKQCHFVMPCCDEDYYQEGSSTEIDVRRDMVVRDALREARKRKFDPSKLLKVRMLAIILYTVW